MLKLTLPKGRIQEKVLWLLKHAGLSFKTSERSYRPVCSDPSVAVKILKPQNIASLVSLGRHDCGFTGHDWVLEQQADVVELLDLGFDPVRIVAAVPDDLVNGLSALQQQRPLIVASEYRRLTQQYIADKKLNAIYVQTYGTTEALPPEDADMIVDNTATGSTLVMNRLTIVDELLRSTTRFVCHKSALDDPAKRQVLEEWVMLFRSTLEAETRVLLEMNVPGEKLEALVKALPAMRSPTVAPLYGDTGFAVKVAVGKKESAALIPQLVAMGAQDILEYRLEKIVKTENR